MKYLNFFIFFKQNLSKVSREFASVFLSFCFLISFQGKTPREYYDYFGVCYSFYIATCCIPQITMLSFVRIYVSSASVPAIIITGVQQSSAKVHGIAEKETTHSRELIFHRWCIAFWLWQLCKIDKTSRQRHVVIAQYVCIASLSARICLSFFFLSLKRIACSHATRVDELFLKLTIRIRFHSFGIVQRISALFFFPSFCSIYSPLFLTISLSRRSSYPQTTHDSYVNSFEHNLVQGACMNCKKVSRKGNGYVVSSIERPRCFVSGYFN